MKLLLGSKHGVVSVDTENADHESCVVGTMTTVRSVAVSRDGIRIACACADKVQVKNLADDSFIILERQWRGYSWKLCFNHQGNYLITVDNFENIKCWDLDDYSCLWSKKCALPHCMQWNDDNQLISLRAGIMWGAHGMLLTIWNPSDGVSCNNMLDAVSCCSLDSSGTMCGDLASVVIHNGSLNFYNVKLRIKVHTVSVPDEKLTECSFSPLATYFACVSSRHCIRVFNTSDWSLMSQVEAGVPRFSSRRHLACSEDSLAFISFGAGTAYVNLYTVITGEMKMRFADTSATTIAFAPSEVVLM